MIPPVEEWPNGPGTALRRLFASAGFKACPRCLVIAWQMNELGPDGCRDGLDGIVDSILPQALGWAREKHRLAARLFGAVGLDVPLLKAAIRTCVLRAIFESEAAGC